ncbi:MAG: 3-dehydroquinate dehydratase [Gammaproteobacteria bacterium]|nr:3-dehydroquinate dehydratase [Gammaproteobacteria bacterium]
MPTSLLVIHGAGMNMRGKTQIDVFGPMTLPEYDKAIRGYAKAADVTVEIFHSNTEGEVVDKLYAAHELGIDGAIINPAGFTVGYPALGAAISQVSFPVYELHISNPALRGRISDIGRVTKGVISGFGIEGYRLAIEGLKQASS